MYGRANGVSRRVDYRDTVDLPARLSNTLAVMKSARSTDHLMAIWESDIGAVEEALAAVNAHDALVDALLEAVIQIEYLHGKLCKETGSGNATIARARAALSLARCSSQVEQPQ
jgi:hypothetical protein